MIKGWLRVVIGGILVAVGLGALLFIFMMGGSRRLYAFALAAPIGIILIIWGIFEVAFKIGYGLFGEAPNDVHPMGTMADSMLFVATADGAVSDSEVNAMLRVLNDVNRCDVGEAALRKRAKQFTRGKVREAFAQQLPMAKTLDDAMLHDIGTALLEVVVAGGAQDQRAKLATLFVIGQLQPSQRTITMVTEAVGAGRSN